MAGKGINTIKVLLRVLDENRDEVVWEHLCYAPSGVYLEFLRKKDINRAEIADWVRVWTREDFNLDIPMTTMKDIKILKELIQDKYLSVYPHIAKRYNNGMDYQGWIRVWLTAHMDKELKKR